MGTPPLVLIVMGVSGAGKSTIAAALNERLHWAFQEGDALHPPANIAKMQAGQPLSDDDRAPWLLAVRHWIDARLAEGEAGLITCSALKHSYRTALVDGRPQVRLLYLKADRAVLRDRLDRRSGHFMPSSLLESQLRTLEEPGPEECPIIVRVDGTLAQSVESCLHALTALGVSAAN